MTEGTSTSDSLCLDQSLKLLSFAEIRGRARLLIQNGEVKVNGEIETRRRARTIRAGNRKGTPMSDFQ
ncbi:MAG TPA: RNA-binding S4 domain-containing protein [Pirellulales bacterium]|jgi:ribosome-associated protein|nr:RNA-binding S4 domain-containing protein [Pirellulales bacterium]